MVESKTLSNLWLAICIGVVVASTAYTCWPLSRAAVQMPTLTAAPAAQDDQVAAIATATIDPGLFTKPLWVVPPTPPAPANAIPDEAPPPPVRLQLVGIVTELNNGAASRRLAAIYNASDDQLHIVASGDQIERIRVIEIGRVAVRMDDGRRQWDLELEQAGRQP